MCCQKERLCKSAKSSAFKTKTSIAVGIIGPGLIGATLLNQPRDQVDLVENVLQIAPAFHYLKYFTGFHEFADIIAEEVGTAESGLNSKALACNNEMVLVLINKQVYMEEKGVGYSHNTSTSRNRGHNIPKDLL
ncbi:4-hydroxyphenylpyruvate dioxygenase [Artemisia annua]|uniref:4-hydroxyphenylpyruvate dioxygenase n=1 Tax=Artemisia annua TaxID=35608 RepID=A0A2U1N8Z0_ARTAN|nr:4-hydroxyphenylpyruvate dioxygenase [Artemisia annua]